LAESHAGEGFGRWLTAALDCGVKEAREERFGDCVVPQKIEK